MLCFFDVLMRESLRLQPCHKRRATARLYGCIILYRQNQHPEYFYSQTIFPRPYRRAAVRLPKKHIPQNKLSHICYADNIYEIIR